MPILGTLLKQGIKIRKSVEQEKKKPFDLQKKQLLQLLSTAKQTEFGKQYKFEKIIRYFGKSKQPDDFYKAFKEAIPLFDYNKIYNEWWHKARAGEPNITWKDQVKYFALSSGTSEASTKHIPVTRDMLRAIQRTSIRQILSLSNYNNLPSSLFGTGILMLGGSTHLNHKSTYFEGDLSGITASQIPFWFQHFYKPGKRIAKNTDWNAKLHEITLNAPKWNIGFIVGVPAWIQIMMERIIEYHKLQTIHDIWPNLTVYTHGGVSFEPYKKGFQKLLSKPVVYIETYLSSEGFIAYQEYPERDMRFVLNNGIFMEFVPFNDKNFNANGELNPYADTYMLSEIEENKDYAILLNTCAGTWRYLLGDTIRLTNKEHSEMIITGRTKHFLSLCGEHLSVDNMNKAIELVADEMNLNIKEFTVAGIPHDTLFAHQWYIGTNDKIDENSLKQALDNKLKELNDDYKVERISALKDIFVKILPNDAFYDWMRAKGKEGGQNKFPRVMKKDQHEHWKEFIQKYEA